MFAEETVVFYNIILYYVYILIAWHMQLMRFIRLGY